jgi:hypothetical protein
MASGLESTGRKPAPAHHVAKLVLHPQRKVVALVLGIDAMHPDVHLPATHALAAKV